MDTRGNRYENKWSYGAEIRQYEDYCAKRNSTESWITQTIEMPIVVGSGVLTIIQTTDSKVYTTLLFKLMHL